MKKNFWTSVKQSMKFNSFSVSTQKKMFSPSSSVCI